MNRDYEFHASVTERRRRVCCRRRESFSRASPLLARPAWAYVSRQRTTEAIMTYFTKKTNTPVGELTLIASERGLAAILWEGDDPKAVRLGPTLAYHHNPT